MKSKLENFMLDAINDAGTGIIDNVVMSDFLDDVTSELMISLLKNPVSIIISNQGLVYKYEFGDEILCPSYGENISADGK